jgi:hypothetical protein
MATATRDRYSPLTSNTTSSIAFSINKFNVLKNARRRPWVFSAYGLQIPVSSQWTEKDEISRVEKSRTQNADLRKIDSHSGSKNDRVVSKTKRARTRAAMSGRSFFLDFISHLPNNEADSLPFCTELPTSGPPGQARPCHAWPWPEQPGSASI